MNDEITVIDRLKIYLEAENIPFGRVEAELGYSNGYLRTLKKSIGSEKLASFLERYTNINIEWLLLGKGSMYRENINEDFQVVETDLDKLSQEHQTIISLLSEVNKNYTTTSNAVLSLLSVLSNIQNDTRQICEEHKNLIISNQNLMLGKITELLMNNQQKTGIEVSGGEKVSVQFGGNSTTNIK